MNPEIGMETLFSIACVVTGCSLCVMGAIKSKFATRTWYMSGLEMVILGGCCAAVAYEIGAIVDGFLPQGLDD